MRHLAQIAIALGYSKLNPPCMRRLLGQQMSSCCFHIERAGDIPDEHIREEPYFYERGLARAEELATKLGLKYKSPLCIGVVTVRMEPTEPGMLPSPLEIAVAIERGKLMPPLALTPVTTHNAAKPQAYSWWVPHETYFAAEAARNLAAAIKTRHESLHLI